MNDDLDSLPNRSVIFVGRYQHPLQKHEDNRWYGFGLRRDGLSSEDVDLIWGGISNQITFPPRSEAEIAASALEDASDALAEYPDSPYALNPRAWLLDRARKIRQGKL